MTTLKTLYVASALVGACALLPVAAFADTGTTKCHGAGIGDTITTIISAGDCEIANRDAYLQAAETRVNGLQKVSSSTQASLEATLSASVNSLATIKASLDADTSTSTARSDYGSIFNKVRVYALVLPRTWIYAASDREISIASDLQTIDTKLTNANSSASSTVQTENAAPLSDLATQISNITTQAQAAQSTVQGLVPDNGNGTLKSNTLALKTAHTALKTIRTDIATALADIKQIRTNLRM
jgi:hypothetical protein